jgi:transposase
MSKFLTANEYEVLRQQHRQEKERRVADRIKSILLYDKGWTYRKIAEALFIDEQTISRHIQEYIEKKKLTLSSGGSQSKLNESQAMEMIKHLEEITYLKISDIAEYVRVAYGVSYTTQGMTCWMHSHGFSFKKPKTVPAKADVAKQEEFIKQYEELLAKTPKDEPILFGDATHPTMATKVTYGWIKTGTNKPIATIASRTRVNIMGAINLVTMKTNIESYKTIDSTAMSMFFDSIRATYPKAPKIHIILDRGAYNMSAVTRKAAEMRQIVLHHLPAYSPNLNPIERLWKVMNEYVRNNKVFKSSQSFYQEIMNFFKITWPKISICFTERINDNFQRLNSTLSI